MAGLTPDSPHPTKLVVHQQSRALEISFSDGANFRLSFEMLRVHSPSAEVQGHGAGQSVLQTGKRDVDLVGLQPVGNYAVQPAFSDGHDTGLYTWAYLYELGACHDELWRRYEARLAEAGRSRDDPMPVAGGSGCGHDHGHGHSH